MAYDTHETDTGGLVKSWTHGVALDDRALKQLRNTASLPIVAGWVAAMPDVHVGWGATIGSVIPTRQAIIPAAVGVDLGCGMMAVRTSMTAAQLPDDLRGLRTAIEAAVPHGRSGHGNRRRDRGAHGHGIPQLARQAWAGLRPGFESLADRHPKLRGCNHDVHLGTLGTGNHFIEVCLDEADRVWFMLHSGSRGVGNRIGSYFIRLAREEMREHLANLPDVDLAYLKDGTTSFDDYIDAVCWAQDYARTNRELMMAAVVDAAQTRPDLPDFTLQDTAVNCHHNYAARETHFGEDLWITRKGAVRAGKGELGIIPGSMGTRSYIVRGKGHPESFCSCSHGAGRAMSRKAARERFTQADHARATAHVECRKDIHVIDETPKAYKDIDAVMAAQSDLVEVVHTLSQVVCVKG